MKYDATNAIGENIIMLFPLQKKSEIHAYSYQGLKAWNQSFIFCQKVLTRAEWSSTSNTCCLSSDPFLHILSNQEKPCSGQVAVVGKSTNAPRTYLNNSVHDWKLRKTAVQPRFA